MAKKVLVFTKRVLPRSNTFVASQGNYLAEFEAKYIGLRHDSSGIDLLEGQETCVQQDYELFPFASRLILDGGQHLTKRWRHALESLSGDLVHAHFGKGGYYCTPISKALNLPLITTFYGSDIAQNDKLSYSKRHREIVFGHSSKIVAISKFVENNLLRRGCPPDKIIQLYIGLDTDFFSPSGTKSEQPSVLFVGRLIEQKGCSYLIEAMKQVQQQLPEATLTIAGYGKHEDKLKSMAANMKNVTFTGAMNRSQVKELLSSSWVTCLPSVRMERGNEESFSMITAESQAVGTPVVAFDTGGVKEALEDRVTGLLSPERNTDQLADNLLSLLKSDTLRLEYATAGIQRANTLFNVKTQSEKLEHIYSKLC